MRLMEAVSSGGGEGGRGLPGDANIDKPNMETLG